jgi:hypothetical protein
LRKSPDKGLVDFIAIAEKSPGSIGLLYKRQKKYPESVTKIR